MRSFAKRCCSHGSTSTDFVATQEVALVALVRADARVRLEAIVALFGPWETTMFILDPLFDPVRDHPRFVALAEQNRAWLETVNP